MRETKVLHFSGAGLNPRGLKQWKNAVSSRAMDLVLSDFPQVQAELDCYLTDGWQILQMSAVADGDVYFLLVR